MGRRNRGSGAARRAPAAASPRRRVSRRAWLSGAALVAVAAIAVFAWTEAADAQDAAVAVQKTAAQREAGHHRKAMAVARLVAMDNQSARTAVLDLADDADDRTALVAIGALCREDFAGARNKLKAIFEDEDRSEFVRSAAIAAFLNRRSADEAAWSDVRSYVRAHTESGDAVRTMALATASKLWGSAVSDE